MGQGRTWQAPAAKVPPITKEQAHQIVQVFNGVLGTAIAKLTGGIPQEAPEHGVPPSSSRAVGAGQTGQSITVEASTLRADAGDFEELYQRIKRRIIDEARVDPILLHILTSSAPELKIDIEPRVIELTESSLRGRICLLLARGFFDATRSNAETVRELKRTGSEPASNRMSEAWASLVNDGVLTREGDGYQKAPGVKVSENVLATR